jgi:hypothetical protein
MDKIEKFLRQLNKKERQYLIGVLLPKIAVLELSGLDVKKIQGYPIWRVRSGRLRILFIKQGKKSVLVRIQTV